MTAPTESFIKLVHRVHVELGGRAPAEDVAKHVLAMADKDAKQHFAERGCATEVRAALRRRNPETGLPLAPCVGNVYVQEALLTVEDYAHLIADHYGAARREQARITAYQQECQSRHDVWLDAADCYARFGA